MENSAEHLTTAVVILNWNGRELLKQLLPGILEHSKEASVYVADNASSDGSLAMLEKDFPQVALLKNRTNGGFAQGYNEALKHLQEDILVLLNSDVEVSPGWLGPILELFQREPSTAAVQPKILDYYNRDHFEYAGAAGGFIDQLGYPYCRGRIFNDLEEDHGQYNDEATIFWASGACLAIRSDLFYEAGGFDQEYFAHQEEVDLCWRLNNLGYQVRYTGGSRVYHMGGATLEKMNPRKTFYNFRNSLYSLLKNVPGKRIWFLLLSRLVLDGMAALKFLLEGKSAHFIAVFQAHMSFYRHIPSIIKKRRLLPKKKDYFQLRSLIMAYFLKGKRKFTDFP